MESWKARRRLKSQKSREALIGSSDLDSSSSTVLRQVESGSIKRTNNSISKDKYAELAQRYSQDSYDIEQGTVYLI